MGSDTAVPVFQWCDHIVSGVIAAIRQLRIAETRKTFLKPAVPLEGTDGDDVTAKSKSLNVDEATRYLS